MRVMKKSAVVVCLLLLALTFFSMPTFSAKAYTTPKENMSIRFYDLKAEVKADRSITMQETIGIHYEKSYVNVGMYWNVSRINKITRVVDGKKYVTSTRAQLSNVQVFLNGNNEYFFIDEQSNYFVINTGRDNDYKKAGDYVVKINYEYALGYDYINEFDDFTFDVFPFGIKQCPSSTAEITLPYELNSQALDTMFFRQNIDRGKIDPSQDFESASGFAYDYSVKNSRTISVRAKNLGENTGLTIQTILPQGYFDLSKIAVDPWYIALCVAVVLITGATILVTVLFRKKRPSIIVPQFYPPDGMSPPEMAHAYHGKVRRKDIAMLVLKWANEQRLRIDCTNKKDFVLIRLQKASLGLKGAEKKYFDTLMKTGKISSKDLKAMPYMSKTQARELSKSVDNVKSAAEKQDVHHKKLPLVRKLLFPLAMLPYLLVCAYFILTGGSPFMLMTMIFPVVASAMFYYFKNARVPLVIFLVAFNAPTAIMLSLNYLPIYDVAGMLIIAIANYIFGFISGILLIDKRNESNMKQLENIYGFRNFLLLAEKQKLEALIEETPSYFFDILPYCYILGITNKMKKKFESISMPEVPDWYSTGISIAVIIRSVPHTVSMSSGGSGGGGGFSGGGGGGSSGGGGGGRGGGGR